MPVYPYFVLYSSENSQFILMYSYSSNVDFAKLCLKTEACVHMVSVKPESITTLIFFSIKRFIRPISLPLTKNELRRIKEQPNH